MRRKRSSPPLDSTSAFTDKSKLIAIGIIEYISRLPQVWSGWREGNRHATRDKPGMKRIDLVDPKSGDRAEHTVSGK